MAWRKLVVSPVPLGEAGEVAKEVVSYLKHKDVSVSGKKRRGYENKNCIPGP